MNFPCQIQQQGDQPVLSIRTRTPFSALPQTLGTVYGRVMQVMGEIGIGPAGAPFVAYYNQDMQDLDVEIGFPVAGQVAGKEDVQFNRIPGGKMATCLYTGPYAQIEAAYNQFMPWVEEQGLQLTPHMYEFYLNDPASTPEAELQTLIVWPVKE